MAQITVTKTDTVKDHRYMRSTVTLYRNGKLVVSTKSWSRKNWNGLKNHSVFVVCVDGKENAIWVSKAYRMTTIGGRLDAGTASEHRDVNDEQAPAAIGEHTASIDIFHSGGDISQSREIQVEDLKHAIEQGADIVQEVKDAIGGALS